MAAPLKIRNKAGDSRRHSSAIQVPPNLAELALALDQAQNTLNALIVLYNAHTHEDTGGGTITVTTPASIWTGLIVTAGDADTVDVSAGEIRKADGTFVTVPLTDELALSAGHATLARVDLVQVHGTTGVVTKKNGTASGSPVAPAVDTGNLPVATIAIAATATVPGAITDVRPRFALTAGDVEVITGTAPAAASRVDGTAKSAADLFTTV